MNDRHSNLGTTRPEYGLIPCVSPRALGGRPLRPLQRLSVRHAGPDGARLPLLLGSMVKTQRPVALSLHVAHAPPGKKHSHTLLTYYYCSLPRCGWHMTPPRGGDPASLASQPLPWCARARAASQVVYRTVFDTRARRPATPNKSWLAPHATAATARARPRARASCSSAPSASPTSCRAAERRVVRGV